MRMFGAVFVLLVLMLAGCSEGPDGAPIGDGSAGESSGGQGASGETTAVQAMELRTVTIAASGGEKVDVRVEIADTPAEQQRGLMGRTALGEDRGMLFVFHGEQTLFVFDGEQWLSFWMKDTLIPLSIAYLDSEGRIVDIQDMKALDDDPPHYVSAEPATYALEVNKGFFDERGVEVGDRAELPE